MKLSNPTVLLCPRTTQHASGIEIPAMVRNSLLLTITFAMLALSPLCLAQSPGVQTTREPTKTTLVTGLPGFKDDSNGSLAVDNGEFAIRSIEKRHRNSGAFHYRHCHWKRHSASDPRKSWYGFYVWPLRIWAISKPVSLQSQIR